MAFQILEWHPILLGTSNTAKIYLYIDADPDLTPLLNSSVRVFIAGTNTGYDGSWITAFLSSSAYIPQYRPIFYNKYKYFTLLLDQDWFGYPTDNGRILINPELLRQNDNKSFEVPKPTPWPSGQNNVLSDGL